MAFQAAALAGFPAVELDLRTTADGEVVVLHDAGIERTTTGNGRVADMRYDDLRSHPTPVGPVPRLDDLLGAMHDWHGLWNFEVKALTAVEPMLQLLEHHHVAGHAQVSSMDPRALDLARRRMPEVPRGLIVLGPPEPEDVARARELGCRWVNCDRESLDPPAVARLHAAGLRVAAWTVNDPDQARALAAAGVECVITDTQVVLDALANDADPRPWF
jgi:glycerophosphoryl diester phosphodiesterase